MIFSPFRSREYTIISIGNRMDVSAFRDLWARVMHEQVHTIFYL